MGNLKIEKFRKRILAEKARLEATQRRLMNHDGEGIAEQMGELADFDINHPGDVATETFEREKDIALNENLDALLAQIGDALARMENGTYGTCERCGQPIAEARLEAIPYATLCIACQTRVEGQ